MKRNSWSTFLLLCVMPAAITALAYALLPKRTPGSIEVLAARRTDVTPLGAYRGADVAVELHYEARPANATARQWKGTLALVAGRRRLWQQDGTAGVLNPVRQDTDRTGTWHGEFNLAKVPESWGEVALVWEATLQQDRSQLLSRYVETVRAGGRIVLRREGEKLSSPRVSRDPQLQVRSVEIGKLRKNLSDLWELEYPVRIVFERGAEILRTKEEDRLRINVEYVFRKGSRPNDELIMSSGKILHPAPPGLAGTQSPQFLRPELALEIPFDPDLPAGAALHFTAIQGNLWPLRFVVPVTDGHGNVVVGKPLPVLVK